MQGPTKRIGLRQRMGIAVVDLGYAAFHVVDVHRVTEVLFIQLLLRWDMGNKRLDKLDEVGHGESLNEVW
jgi:hypothetical protein